MDDTLFIGTITNCCIFWYFFLAAIKLANFRSKKRKIYHVPMILIKEEPKDDDGTSYA